MKISKSKLRQIIKEELSAVHESDWYDDENETRADRKYSDRPSPKAKQAHDLTKAAPPKALLKAASALILDPMTSATIRKFVFDLVKDLDDEDFNNFEEALATAVDPWGEGY